MRARERRRVLHRERRARGLYSGCFVFLSLGARRCKHFVARGLGLGARHQKCSRRVHFESLAGYRKRVRLFRGSGDGVGLRFGFERGARGLEGVRAGVLTLRVLARALEKCVGLATMGQ